MSVIVRREGRTWLVLKDGERVAAEHSYAKVCRRFPEHKLELDLPKRWPEVTHRWYPDAGIMTVRFLEIVRELPTGFHQYTTALGIQTLARASAAEAVPAGAEQLYITDAIDPWMTRAPLPLTRLEADEAAEADLTSPSAVVALRPRDGRLLVSLGLGVYEVHVPGSYESDEEALAVGRVAWEHHVRREVDQIRALRGGRLDWGVPIRPRRDPIVIRCRDGERAQEAFHRWKSEQEDEV